MRILGPDKTTYTSYEVKSARSIEKTDNKEVIDTRISKDSEIRQKSVEKLKEIDKIERQEKIDKLKAQIKSGEYKIDPEELAEIIVDYIL